MYKIPANTLFVGKNLIYVPECHSTNTLAQELCQKTFMSEGTVVVTDNQSKGRGQRGNVWLSMPGMNLTFSVILKPVFLKPVDQFNLTIVISLSIHDFLCELIPEEIKIKWPNDLLICGKKTCGILIENTISGSMLQQSIVGIGINVNQPSFSLDQATSMKVITGKEFNLSDSLALVLLKLEQRYLQMRNGKYHDLKAEYMRYLFGFGKQMTFADSEGKFDGVIQGVTDDGRLVISRGEQIKKYNFKEVTFL